MRILVDFFVVIVCLFFVLFCFLERENREGHELREGEAEGGRRDWGREEKLREGEEARRRQDVESLQSKAPPCLVPCFSLFSDTHRHKASASLSPHAPTPAFTSGGATLCSESPQAEFNRTF